MGRLMLVQLLIPGASSPVYIKAIFHIYVRSRVLEGYILGQALDAQQDAGVTSVPGCQDPSGAGGPSQTQPSAAYLAAGA